MVRVSKLSEEEIGALYQSDVRITEIARRAEVSRQAIFNTLRRIGVHDPRHGTRTLICKFCGEQYQLYRKKAEKSLYCSIPCYNADKDGIGYYGRRGTIEKYEKEQGITLRRSRGYARKMMDAQTGEVIHHKDGNPFNNDPGNLMRFSSHAAHMRYHAEQRKAKHA